MKIVLIGLMGFLITQPPAHSAEALMSGLRLQQYGDFTKEWKLVTVRFRKDTSEMRFTYANPKAWKALAKGEYPLPEGSVLAKVGFKSGIDPAFDSSVVPSGARRFQFMVKDSKKFKDTDGWGYALFQSDGNVFPGEEKAQTLACHACHKLVPERDYVFSEIAELSPLTAQLKPTYDVSKNEKHLRFVDLKRPESQGPTKDFLTLQKVRSTRIISGEMRQYFFGGTLDEITPVLIHEAMAAKESGLVGFVSNDGRTFKFVKITKNEKCSDSEAGVKIWERREEWVPSGNPLREQLICYPKTNSAASP